MLFCHLPGQQLSGANLGEAGGPSDAPAVFYDPYGRRLIPVVVDVGDRPETWYYVDGMDPSTAQPMTQLYDQITTWAAPPPPLVQAAVNAPAPPAPFTGGSTGYTTVQTLYTPAQQGQVTAIHGEVTPTQTSVATQPIGQPIPTVVPSPAPPPSISAPAPSPVSTVTGPTPPAPAVSIVAPGSSGRPPTAVIAVPPGGGLVEGSGDVPGGMPGDVAGGSKGGGVLALLALAALAFAGS